MWIFIKNYIKKFAWLFYLCVALDSLLEDEMRLRFGILFIPTTIFLIWGHDSYKNLGRIKEK